MTPLTNPAFIGRMKELDVKFTSMKSEMFGVAKTVDTIDWASYGQSTTTRTHTPWGAIVTHHDAESRRSVRILVAWWR